MSFCKFKVPLLNYLGEFLIAKNPINKFINIGQEINWLINSLECVSLNQNCVNAKILILLLGYGTNFDTIKSINEREISKDVMVHDYLSCDIMRQDSAIAQKSWMVLIESYQMLTKLSKNKRAMTNIFGLLTEQEHSDIKNKRLQLHHVDRLFDIMLGKLS